MKVAIVTNEYPTVEAPHVGIFTRLNAQAIAVFHDVTVVHLRSEAVSGEGNRYQDGAVTVRAYPNGLLTPEDYDKAATVIHMLAPGFDVVHTMNLRSLIPFGLAHREGEKLEAAWIHSEPGKLQTPLDWPEGVIPVEELLELPDGLTAPAGVLLKDARKVRFAGYTGVVPFIVPAPGSVVGANFPGYEELFGAFVERPRVAGELRLVSVGAISSKRQPEVAIRTVKTLRAQGVEATLTWVGEGFAKIRSQEKARELGVSEYVRFVSAETAGGAQAAIDAADLFIGPAKDKESFYLPLCQALLSGRPAVLGEGAAGVGYLDGSVTRIVSEKNSKAWAAACLELQAATLSMSAAQVAATVPEKYSPAAVGAAYDAAYRETRHITGWES